MKTVLQKGFAPIVILIIVAIAIASIGYLTLGKKFELVGPTSTTSYEAASPNDTFTSSAFTPSPQVKTAPTKTSTTQTQPRQKNNLIKFICDGGWTKPEFKYDPQTNKPRTIQVYNSVDGKYYKQDWEDEGTNYYDSQGRLGVLEGPGVWESEQFGFFLEYAKTLTYRQEDLCKTN